MGPPEDEEEAEEVGEWYGVDTRICGVNSVSHLMIRTVSK